MLSIIQSRILDQGRLLPLLAKWRLQGKRIVFTNGCFDILHYGHIHYLSQARALGDKLIIGVNSKASVSRLKGDHRPIQDDQSRYHLLAALVFVDAVIEFGEDTPLPLIQLIQPDILVKGGDWPIDEIVGSDIVLKKGGVVKSLPFVEGYSTTKIEERIKGG